jgi:uncharacterized protein YunC (DUF1805 family)
MRKGMQEKTIRLKNSEAAGYVVPLGPVNLVWVVAKNGLVGCGAFDVKALEKFGYPAARVRAVRGPSVSTLDDLLSGEIRETNTGAEDIGVAVGMSGREALDLLS